MCGIYGQSTTSELDIRHAEGSTDFLSHRSPDDRGTVLRGNVFLGMRRLSIIDLSGCRQSIWNADQSCCAVYNGELQNFLSSDQDWSREVIVSGLGVIPKLFYMLTKSGVRIACGASTGRSPLQSGMNGPTACFWRATGSAKNLFITTTIAGV